MALHIPKYYTRVNSMPNDPEGSQPYMTQTETAGIFIMLFPAPSENSMPYDNAQAVSNGIHAALGEGQGLIEVEAGTTGKGRRYIYSIVKTHKQPVGVQYTLTMHVEYASHTECVQGFFDEINTTGLRDNTVLAMYMNETGGDMTGWFRDPYDPEYKHGLLMNASEEKDFDKHFPAHPLSMARELVAYICEKN